MVLALNIIGVVTSLAAAVFWLLSARVVLPVRLDLTWNGDDPTFFEFLNKQSRLSAIAAICAAVAAISQGLVLIARA